MHEITVERATDSIRQTGWTETASGCWEWAGTICRGYGVLYVDGKHWRAHRLAYVAANGPIPEGAVICHRCDNRRCMNPGHLFAGTQAENLADMRQKGRDNRAGLVIGRRGRGRFTADEVAEIRRLCAAGESQVSVARRFGLRSGHVNNIVHGRRYPIRTAAT